LAFAPSAEIGRDGTAAPPSQERRPRFEEKHGREDPKGGVSAILRRRGS
jgi:hypothetical protein